MKTNHLLLFLMLLFLFSCEGEKIDFSIINRSIRVKARIDGVKTRVANDTWSEGDVIGIYMITAGEGLSAESVLAKNAKYVTEGDGAFNPVAVAHDVKFPIDGAGVDFIAYYPHGTVSAAFEYSVDVTDQTDQTAIDLLYSNNATGLNKNSTFVDLDFSHQLSKIIVHLGTIDGSALKDVAVTIKGVDTKGKFSLADKSQTTSGKGNIEMKMSGDGASAEAIVLPAGSLTDATLEIINGEYSYVYDLNSAVNITKFESGYKYIYTIVLDTRSPLSATTSISGWLDGPGEMATVVKDSKIYRPVGGGTPENPYTVEDARNLSPINGAWVKGYIVGYYSGTTVGSFSNDLADNGQIKVTSLALAESPVETSGSKTFPVSLPTGEIRENLNLKTHPENLGKEVKLKGNIGPYYGSIGMQNVTAYEFILAGR